MCGECRVLCVVCMEILMGCGVRCGLECVKRLDVVCVVVYGTMCRVVRCGYRSSMLLRQRKGSYYYVGLSIVC